MSADDDATPPPPRCALQLTDKQLHSALQRISVVLCATHTNNSNNKNSRSGDDDAKASATTHDVVAALHALRALVHSATVLRPCFASALQRDVKSGLLARLADRRYAVLCAACDVVVALATLDYTVPARAAAATAAGTRANVATTSSSSSLRLLLRDLRRGMCAWLLPALLRVTASTSARRVAVAQAALDALVTGVTCNNNNNNNNDLADDAEGACRVRVDGVAALGHQAMTSLLSACGAAAHARMRAHALQTLLCLLQHACGTTAQLRMAPHTRTLARVVRDGCVDADAHVRAAARRVYALLCRIECACAADVYATLPPSARAHVTTPPAPRAAAVVVSSPSSLLHNARPRRHSQPPPPPHRRQQRAQQSARARRASATSGVTAATTTTTTTEASMHIGSDDTDGGSDDADGRANTWRAYDDGSGRHTRSHAQHTRSDDNDSSSDSDEDDEAVAQRRLDAVAHAATASQRADALARLRRALQRRPTAWRAARLQRPLLPLLTRCAHEATEAHHRVRAAAFATLRVVCALPTLRLCVARQLSRVLLLCRAGDDDAFAEVQVQAAAVRQYVLGDVVSPLSWHVCCADNRSNDNDNENNDTSAADDDGDSIAHRRHAAACGCRGGGGRYATPLLPVDVCLNALALCVEQWQGSATRDEATAGRLYWLQHMRHLVYATTTTTPPLRARRANVSSHTLSQRTAARRRTTCVSDNANDDNGKDALTRVVARRVYVLALALSRRHPAARVRRAAASLLQAVEQQRHT